MIPDRDRVPTPKTTGAQRLLEIVGRGRTLDIVDATLLQQPGRGVYEPFGGARAGALPECVDDAAAPRAAVLVDAQHHVAGDLVAVSHQEAAIPAARVVGAHEVELRARALHQGREFHAPALPHRVVRGRKSLDLLEREVAALRPRDP